MSDIENDAIPYDASYDYDTLAQDSLGFRKECFDPRGIDYSVESPNDIVDMEEALSIATYLRTQDRGLAEDTYYNLLLEKFGWYEADPTELTQEEALLVASDFFTFVKYMFLCEYGFKFLANWHHELLCNTLQDVFLGRIKIPRVIVNIPPRYSKTQVLIYWVTWTMGHQPDSEYIWISYSNLLSEESSTKIRSILLNEKYTRIFDVELDMSSKAKNNFSTTKKGKVYATSTGGTLTGKGAGKFRKSFGGAIIVDDGNNSLDAFSEINRNKANDWVVNTLLSRRNNIAYTPILVIAQRVHENDISGFLLPSAERSLGGAGETFTHIKIPAILSKKDIDTLQVPHDSDTVLLGDAEADEYPLWAQKIDLEKLRNMREHLPTLTFFGQYQQEPIAGDGAIIKSTWLRQVKPPSKEDIAYKVMVIDSAQTASKRSDFSVILTAFILKEGTVFIDNIWRKRVESPELVSTLLNDYRAVRPTKIYIEYKASGINLIQYLKQEKVPLPIVPIPRNANGGDGDKVCRANGVSPYINAGYVTVKENAEWLPLFYSEVMAFPNGRFDDQVDALVDLVAREVVKGKDFMFDIEVEGLPLKGHTYAEEMAVESTSSIEQELESIYNYRGKTTVLEEDSVSWANGLF